MRIALLTRSQYRSPRFLAESLLRTLNRLGIPVGVYYDGVQWLEAISQKNHGRRNRLMAEYALWRIKQLIKYDLIIISDTVGAACKDVFSLAPLRQMDKPVLFFEVFYVGGSQYWLDRLPGDPTNKFDAYLSVCGIHDSTPISNEKVYTIGLDLLPSYPFQATSRPFTALLDFARDGYEKERAIQERVLKSLNISTTILEGEYSFAEIEKIYQSACVTFVASPEAFGVPIVQVQHYGSYIASPKPSWVKRHALLLEGTVFYDVDAPEFTDNFIFYEDEDHLAKILTNLQRSYDAVTVRSRLLENQPSFCKGNLDVLWAAIRSFI